MKSWNYWNKIMTVIGTIATVVGTGVGIWAFVYPADMSGTMISILERMQTEPALVDSERYMIEYIYCDDDENVCKIYGNKDSTTLSAKLSLVACDADTKKKLSEQDFAFSRTAAMINGKFPLVHSSITLILNFSDKNGDSNIVQHWIASDDRVDSWTMKGVTDIASGKRDCRTAG